MVIPNSLKDPGTERALIATIMKHGKDAFIDADGIVNHSCFSNQINRSIYTCLSELNEEGLSFDTESIKMKAKNIGNLDLNDRKVIEYIELLQECSTSIDNVIEFAIQVKKFAVKRDLFELYSNGMQKLAGMTGNETMSEIISCAESDVLDYISGNIDGSTKIEKMGENIIANLNELINSEIVDQPGIPTGFPLWDAAIGGGLRGGTVHMKGSRAKCFNPYTTCLLTDKGPMMGYELHDINTSTDNITYNLVNKNGQLEKPILWLSNGKEETLIIITKYGRKIEVTPDHPLLTLNKEGYEEWVEAKNLTTDMYLISRRGDNIFGDRKINLDDAYMCGVMVGDGHIFKNGNKAVSVTTMDSEIVEETYNFAQRFGLKVRKSLKRNDTTANKASQYSFTHGNKRMSDFFCEEDYYYNGEKYISKKIRSCTKECICEFLSGLFDTDGCLEELRRVTLTAKSELLITQVSTILLNLGILCSIRKRMVKLPFKDEVRPYFEISINSVNNVRLFNKLIGFRIKRKQDLLNYACLGKSAESQDCIPNIHTLLSKFKLFVLSKRKQFFIGKDSDRYRTELRDRYTVWCRLTDQAIRRVELSEILKYFIEFKDNIEYRQLEKLIDQHLMFDKVKKIENGFSTVCDYVMPKTQSFIANTIINHNCGKSFDAMNNARNVSNLGIPTLYLDSELTGKYQEGRLISIDSGCAISLYETGKFKLDKDLLARVKESALRISRLPLYYENISGKMAFEVLTLIRRWLVKVVGFQDNGLANNCVVIYDYIKLVSNKEINASNPEHIAIGFLMTEIHNFAIKYNIPILGYMQLNRDGIDSNDSSIVASSDRILWLCSSLSFIKNKDENDIAMGDGWNHGNKKLIVCETRHGPGLEDPADYINLHASLRPNVANLQACGSIREGFTHSSITQKGLKNG